MVGAGGVGAFCGGWAARGGTCSGGGKSTRAGGTETPLGGTAAGETGCRAGFSVAAGTGGPAEATCFFSSVISRWKDLYCLSCSSLLLSRSPRSLLYLTKRYRVRKGVSTNKIPKITSSGMG